jgi:type I restriction enzyme R subunit
MTKAFALAGSRAEAAPIRNDVALFADVRAAVLKIRHSESGSSGSGTPEMETAIRQLVDEAVTGEGVVDVYRLAGIETPELSDLLDEFLDGLATKDKPNLQMGLLRRLLADQVKTVRRTNVVQGRRFSEQLDEAINRYTNRALTTAAIIAELVRPAKEMRAKVRRLLAKYDYPPDLEESAIELVLEQAEQYALAA